MNSHKQYISRVLNIGGMRLGGRQPLRIQSMTNTPTMDVDATSIQAIELFEAGCEIVRITARNMKEAGALEKIRAKLENQGYNIPLVADIHFNPRVAEEAATIVHKIRINPGNYLDRQFFLSKEQKHDGGEPGRNEIVEGVLRLTDICRKHGTLIRVGVNHGSLSERILMKYGNTARGMVASAMEFLEICHENNFHELLVSMKSSHVPTMITATRDIVQEMMAAGIDYPIHLGVTEAGEGEDGRVRSAAGIGPLLGMGIGDTIRVSLTEDPVAEIPVAKILRDHYEDVRQPEKVPLAWQNEEVSRKPELVEMKFPDHNPEVLTVVASAEMSSLIMKAKDNDFRIIGESGKEYPDLVLKILQATGVRISGTEYISCPTCGRTTFDIQRVLKEVKQHTKGLKNVKIAVMGCIVNGPGEMADADYGYVGAAPGKVTLYHKGKTVMKNIPEKDALKELLELINKTLPGE
ncbi:MAG: 4-hydroxy-3-methylbut-2-en-1-yl diphosphate synthase [Bacteroidetes bacterium]|nr:MAG: 4-hydroxy-3-methylbut-2-en-1-yl diphosphate synthase [Bacteroidota bacterium]